MDEKKTDHEEERLLGQVETLATGGFKIAGVAALVFLGAYLVNFWGQKPSSDPQYWGQFGDYIGGTLNPVFGFISLLVLLCSGLIFTDTSIGGTITYQGDVNETSEKDIRQQLQAASRANDQRSRAVSQPDLP